MDHSSISLFNYWISYTISFFIRWKGGKGKDVKNASLVVFGCLEENRGIRN